MTQIQAAHAASQKTGFSDRSSLDSSLEMIGAVMNFGRNEEIYGEGEAAEYLYLVKTGCVRAYKILSDGRRQVGAFYLPGDVFGIEADAEHTHSTEAVGSCAVVVVKRSALASRATGNSKLSQLLLDLTINELKRAQNHILLLIQSAQERVAGFLLEMAARERKSGEINLPMSRQDIADYLGLTIETVSRTLTQLENNRAIALPSSRRVVLRNYGALARLNA